jgi:hypothetical protein
MSSPIATFSSCRRNYLRRVQRVGVVVEIEPLRAQIVREALEDQPRPRPKPLKAGWSICRLCDALYKTGARSYLKGFAIVRCTDCGVWQRAKVVE